MTKVYNQASFNFNSIKNVNAKYKIIDLFAKDTAYSKISIENFVDIIYKEFNLIKKISNKLDNKIVFFLIINEIVYNLDVSNSTKNQLLENFNHSSLFFSNNFSEILLTLNLSKQEIVKIKKHLQKMKLDKLAMTVSFKINDILGLVSEKIINKKELGAYYTSFETTDYIVINSMIPQIITNWAKKDKKLNIFLNKFNIDNRITFIEYCIKKDILFTEFVKLTKIYKTESLENIINSLKIIDISCGSGSFVFSVYRLLKKFGQLLGFPFRYDNIYGIDLDSEAILILKTRILLEKSIDKNDLSIDNFIQGNSLTKQVYRNKFLTDIIKNGGFDIVVGNPPYLEKRNVKSYEINDFKTIKCNNLYAFFLEENLKILKSGGNMGMIVPISYISTKRMFPIRNLLLNNSKYQFCSSFADRPSCLFNGVHQKLNIILLEKQKQQCNLYTSDYIHWYKDEKANLFDKITYVENKFINKDFLYKLGNDTELKIIRKLINSKMNLLENCSIDGNYKVWVNMRLCFWNKAFTYPQKSKEYKVFSFNSELDATLFSALINSNMYFFFWEKISDVWHITLKDLENFKIDFSLISNELKEEINTLYKKFEINLEKHKKHIGTKQIEYEYQHKKDKILIDEIDKVFAKVFDLSNKEVEYLRNYQLKYRMNGELSNYLKVRNA